MKPCKKKTIQLTVARRVDMLVNASFNSLGPTEVRSRGI